MSKIYNKYLELKNQDKEKMYLFSCGNFYIFLDEDAEKINEYVVLKKTNFSKNCIKCGFPKNSVENYLKVFQNHKLPIVLVEEQDLKTNEERLEKIVETILNIDIIKITPLEAINTLDKLQKMCQNK